MLTLNLQTQLKLDALKAAKRMQRHDTVEETTKYHFKENIIYNTSEYLQETIEKLTARSITPEGI